MNCWKCREPVSGPACPGCGTLQPPGDRDLFQALGLPRSWRQDPAAVDRAWLARSRIVHPDRFAGRPALERRLALQWTALVNEGRRVLRDPVARAWLLATGSPRPPEHGPPVQPRFLERVFDWQVRAEAGDPAVSGEVARAAAEIEARIDAAFAAWEDGGDPPAEVPELLSRLKYVHNLAKQTRSREPR